MADLRVALLGVGMMGAFHAELLATRVRGASVGVVSDVDAVLIATPGAAHYVGSPTRSVPRWSVSAGAP